MALYAIRTALGSRDLPAPRQQLVVVRLNAVLTKPIAVDKSENVTRKAALCCTTRLRVVAHTHWRERDRWKLPSGGGGPHQIGLLVGKSRVKDAPLTRRVQARGEARSGLPIKFQQRNERVAHGGLLLGTKSRRLRNELLAHHGAGEDHTPASIGDGAAEWIGNGGIADSTPCRFKEALAINELPLREATEAECACQDQDCGNDEGSALRIGPHHTRIVRHLSAPRRSAGRSTVRSRVQRRDVAPPARGRVGSCLSRPCESAQRCAPAH